MLGKKSTLCSEKIWKMDKIYNRLGTNNLKQKFVIIVYNLLLKCNTKIILDIVDFKR
jgi:hypothetical protein